MDPLFFIWFGFSLIIFFVGIFVYRKGLCWQIGAGTGQVVDFNESQTSKTTEEDQELAKLTVLYRDALATIDRLTQKKEDSLSHFEAQHQKFIAAKDETLNLLKSEQEKLRVQLAEEKKYSEQSAEDYRGQIRNIDQLLNQLKADQQIILKEKDIIVNKLLEEKDVAIAQSEEISRKAAELELKLQEAAQTIQSLKNDFVPSESTESEDIKKPLQKSIILLKELKADNDHLFGLNQTLTQKLDRLEAANQNLEDKGQQLQYELVKSRAQLLGLEQICNDLKKKLENSVVS